MPPAFLDAYRLYGEERPLLASGSARLGTDYGGDRRAEPMDMDSPVGLLGIYLILLFPDGRLPSRRWRPLARLSGAVMVLASLSITLAPGPLEGHPGVRNPLGLEGHPWIVGATLVVILLLPVCILASALSLILRYRRSGGRGAPADKVDSLRCFFGRSDRKSTRLNSSHANISYAVFC